MKTKHTRLCCVVLAVIALGASILSNTQAGLLDDWFACKQDVLPRLGGQSPSDAAAQYCMSLGYMTGQLDGKRDRNATHA